MKAKKAKKLPANNTPVPDNFHPKDTIQGYLFIMSGFASCASHRGTVYIQVGGGTAECTVGTAQKFANQLACAINCAKNDGGKSGE